MPYFKSQGKLVTIGSSSKFLTYTDAPKEYEFVRVATTQTGNHMQKLSRKGNLAAWTSITGNKRVLIFNLNPYTLLLNHPFAAGQITWDVRSSTFNAAGDKLYIAWYVTNASNTIPSVPYLSVYSYVSNTLTQIYKQSITGVGTSTQIFDIDTFTTPNGSEYLLLPFVGDSKMRIWRILSGGITFESVYSDTISFYGVHVTSVIDNETVEFMAAATRFRLNFITGVKTILTAHTPKFLDVRYPYMDTTNNRMFLGSVGNSALQVFNTQTGNFSEFIRNTNMYSEVYSAITYGSKLYVATTNTSTSRILEFNRI